MIGLAGYRIDRLPFEKLEKVQDILYADGPILSHYSTSRGKDILFYWVDFDEICNRWLTWETSKKDLFDYLSGGISLFQYLSERCPEYLFIIDIDANNQHKNAVMLNSYAIPEEYYPNEDSYFTLGLPTFYDYYLTDGSYISRLREHSYVFNLTPTDVVYATTIAAKEAGQFLLSITKSIESYIDVTATDKLKYQIGDRSRLNRTINQIKQKVSPRISDSVFGSFQVSIAIDTLTLPVGNKEIEKWGKEVVESYKNDVLDVDYTNEDDAAAIISRFPDAEVRKKIFDPIFRILENPAYSLKVTSYNNSFKRDYKKKRPGENFKVQILPQQSLEEILILQERKAKIVTAIFKLPQGGSISDLKKKELFENLLFTQEGTEPKIPITSPITSGEISINISRPLECTIRIDDNGNIVLSNVKLGLFAEGVDVKAVVELISQQFLELYNQHISNPEYVDEKMQELDRIIDD